MSPSFRILFALLHFMTSAERPEHKEEALEATTGSKPNQRVLKEEALKATTVSKPYKQGSTPDHGLSVRATGGFQSLSHKQKPRSMEARRHDPEGSASSFLQQKLQHQLDFEHDIKGKLVTGVPDPGPIMSWAEKEAASTKCAELEDETHADDEDCKKVAADLEARIEKAKTCIDAPEYSPYAKLGPEQQIAFVFPDGPCKDYNLYMQPHKSYLSPAGFGSYCHFQGGAKAAAGTKWAEMCDKWNDFQGDLDKYEQLGFGFKQASSNLRAHLTQLNFDSRVKNGTSSLDTAAIAKIKADVAEEVGALSDEGVQRQLHGLGMKDQDIAAWIALQASRDYYIAPDDQRGVLDVHGKAMTWDKETGAFKAVGEGAGEAAPAAAAGTAGARAAAAVADDSSKDQVKTEETLQDAIRQRRIPKVYTTLTTYEKHDMDWLHKHVDPKSNTSVNKDLKDTANDGEAVLPPIVTDTGMYDDLKDKLIEKESLILSQNTEGTDDYSPYEFSVKRFKETGTISWNKNNDYQKALKSYVESLFHMSAGAADITKKEYAVHTRNSAELTKRIEEANLKSYKTEQDKPQGWDCPPGSTNCGNSFFKEHCQNLGKDQTAVKACEENFDTLCTGEGDGDSYATCNQFKQWLMSAQTASGSLTLTLESAQQSCKADATCMEELKTEFDRCIGLFSIGTDGSGLNVLNVKLHKENQEKCEGEMKKIQGPWLQEDAYKLMYHDHCEKLNADAAKMETCETELNDICSPKDVRFSNRGGEDKPEDAVAILEECNKVKAWIESVQDGLLDAQATLEKMQEVCDGHADAEQYSRYCRSWVQGEFTKCIKPLQEAAVVVPVDEDKMNEIKAGCNQNMQDEALWWGCKNKTETEDDVTCHTK